MSEIEIAIGLMTMMMTTPHNFLYKMTMTMTMMPDVIENKMTASCRFGCQRYYTVPWCVWCLYVGIYYHVLKQTIWFQLSSPSLAHIWAQDPNHGLDIRNWCSRPLGCWTRFIFNFSYRTILSNLSSIFYKLPDS